MIYMQEWDTLHNIILVLHAVMNAESILWPMELIATNADEKLCISYNQSILQLWPWLTVPIGVILITMQFFINVRSCINTGNLKNKMKRLDKIAKNFEKEILSNRRVKVSKVKESETQQVRTSRTEPQTGLEMTALRTRRDITQPRHPRSEMQTLLPTSELSQYEERTPNRPATRQRTQDVHPISILTNANQGQPTQYYDRENYSSDEGPFDRYYR